jgi:hypothetical protein
MPPLLQVGPLRASREAARAAEADEAQIVWRRAWGRVYLQCVGLALLGYAGYGLSFGLTGDRAVLLASASFLVAYVLPLGRLLTFFLRHADQF